MAQHPDGSDLDFGAPDGADMDFGSPGGTDVAVKPPETDRSTGSKNRDGDHDRFAHYVVGGTAAITRAMVTGEPCTALCGKVWTPGSNGAGFQVCPTCKDMANGINSERFEDW